MKSHIAGGLVETFLYKEILNFTKSESLNILKSKNPSTIK